VTVKVQQSDPPYLAEEKQIEHGCDLDGLRVVGVPRRQTCAAHSNCIWCRALLARARKLNPPQGDDGRTSAAEALTIEQWIVSTVDPNISLNLRFAGWTSYDDAKRALFRLLSRIARRDGVERIHGIAAIEMDACGAHIHAVIRSNVSLGRILGDWRKVRGAAHSANRIEPYARNGGAIGYLCKNPDAWIPLGGSDKSTK